MGGQYLLEKQRRVKGAARLPAEIQLLLLGLCATEILLLCLLLSLLLQQGLVLLLLAC